MNRLKRRDWLICLLIVAAALILRVVGAWQLAGENNGMNAVFSPSPETDMATYWKLSGEILTGAFTGEFYYQPFYYAVWLPALRWVWNSAWCVVAAQIVLGSAVVYLSIVLGRLAAGRNCGRIAGVLSAIAAPLLLYTPYLIIANVQTFFLTGVALVGLMIARQKNHHVWRRVLILGILLGCAILSRGNAWFVMPGVIMLYLIVLGWRRGVLAAGLTLLAVILIQLPFIIHNSTELGRLAGPSTAAGQVLALGNTPEAPPGGRDFNSLAGPMEYPPAFHLWMAEAGEISVAEQILRWAEQEPLAFAELQFRKLLLFWDWRDIPNNVALYGEGAASFIGSMGFTTGIILSFGLAGLLYGVCRAVRRRDWGLLWLCYLAAGFCAATAVFYDLSRFRAPILPLLGVLAGCFIIWSCRRIRRNRRAVMICAAVMIFSVFIVWNGYDFYSRNCEVHVMKLVRPNGVNVGNMTLDNGPMSFGGWSEYYPAAGDVVSKKLVADPDLPGEAELTLFCRELPGRIFLRIDGKPYSFAISKPVETVKFPVHGNSTVMEVVTVSPGLAFIYDAQRDYGRTLLNGKPLSGELVFRLFQ